MNSSRQGCGATQLADRAHHAPPLGRSAECGAEPVQGHYVITRQVALESDDTSVTDPEAPVTSATGRTGNPRPSKPVPCRFTPWLGTRTGAVDQQMVEAVRNLSAGQRIDDRVTADVADYRNERVPGERGEYSSE